MTFQFSPVRKRIETKVVKKENESEKVEVLSLAPFTCNPKLFFEDVKIGESATRKLVVDNPTNEDVQIAVSHNIPSELDVTFNWTEATILNGNSSVLDVTWCPTKGEHARYTITIHGEKILRNVPVVFKSVSPKKTRTGAKPKSKPQPTVRKQTSAKNASPTKKYYSTRPPNISPQRYSPQKRHSPITNKPSPSSKKASLLVISGQYSPAAKKSKPNSESPKSHYAYKWSKETTTFKENIPVLDVSTDSSVFGSPASSTFRLDYLSSERRQTYVVNGQKQKSPECVFNDSLEAVSPNFLEPPIPNERGGKLPLGISNRDNVPQTPAPYDFEYKLKQLESFSFSPLSTPVSVKTDIFNPTLSSTIERYLLTTTLEPANVTLPFPDKNHTFEVPSGSPNASSETYVKANISTETYVKGNASFETYVKGNVSGGTYTKDSSVGDVANLSLSPLLPKTNSPTHSLSFGLAGDSVRHVIEANLWTGMKREPLSSIKEESYMQQSMTEEDPTQRSFYKRKSHFDISTTPSKRANAPVDWSRKGGAAFRVAKKTAGLNLKQFLKAPEGEASAVLTKRDTNIVIVQNPFLLAATNLADPFMTPHLFIDEAWLDQQQVDFRKWLNALLTPPEELKFEEQVVDVAKVWQECKKKELEVAPTKEEVSSKYHTNNKLNSLRKSAQNLFRSKEMTAVLTKVVLAVETGKLAIRDDKDIHLNLVLKSEIMSMLLSYNPLWLRIGLETIFNEIIPLKSNSDAMGLSTFIATRLLRDSYLLKKHKSLYSPKYIVDFKKFFLKKFFVLVYFLDRAKNLKLIPYDPCLFCKKAPVKESKGDADRHIDYVVTHSQTYIHEFDYAVKNLGVDLRDGVRLTKVMELILLQDDLTVRLRVPAISRLQKVHNMKIVFDSLEKAGYKILYDITPKDIVDGHKEKTLSFLWQIIYKFQAPLMVKSATTIQTWFRSLPVTLRMRRLKRARLQRENAATKIQNWYRRLKLSRKLSEFASLLRKHMESVRRERAVLKIQSYYKMCRCRREYAFLYVTILNIQRLSRGWLVRNVHRKRIESAVVIQRNVRMCLARKRYLKLKEAANVIQTKYRAKKLMEMERTTFIQIKTATMFIQRKFRANKHALVERKSYVELRSTTTWIQQRFRANRLCRIERKRFLEIRTATVRIQTWYRSLLTTRIHRQQYLALKKSVVAVEQRYLALKAGHSQRNHYLVVRRSCIIIQQKYRACKMTKTERREFLELKVSAIVIQHRYRAKKKMEIERSYYQKLKSAAIFVQRRFRANRATKVARDSYLAQREASIKIQRWFRATMAMMECRTYYNSLKRAVLVLENIYEAKMLMGVQRKGYLELRSATVIIQRRYRAQVIMREARGDYLRLERGEFEELRRTAVVIQRKWRCVRVARQERSRYTKLRQSALFIQRRWRAKTLGNRERTNYLRLKHAAVVAQRRWRAKKLLIEARNTFLELRAVVVDIQTRWRAVKLGRQCLESYQELRRVTVFIQRTWRVKQAGRRDRNSYIALRAAAVCIQRRWRAKKLFNNARNSFLELRLAVVVIQIRWRAMTLRRQCLESYQELRRVTVFIQRTWRVKQAGRRDRNSYIALRAAAVCFQRRWRAKKLFNQARNSFMELRLAVIVIQIRWRAMKLRRQCLESYQELRRVTVFIQRTWRLKQAGRRDRNNYITLRAAAVCVQRGWRARREARMAVQRYESIKRSTVILQRWFRASVLMRRERERYLELRAAAIVVQRRYRATLRMRKERMEYESKRGAVVGLQKYIRGYLVRRKYAEFLTPEAREMRRMEKVERQAAVKIQSVWRGYNYRRSMTPKLLKLNERAQKANTQAEPQNTLNSRCTTALQWFVSERTTLSVINKALEDFDFITRHSKVICRRVADFLPAQLYLMIEATNRSLPEMTTCVLSVRILINIYKYAPTRKHSFAPDYMDNIVKVMLHWCDKDAQLFPSMCTLLWLFAHEPKWKRVITALPTIQQRLEKIRTQVARKESMVRRAGVKGASVFAPYGSLPLPSLDSDWGLEYKHKPYAFTNSVHALSSLLTILDM
ncbi:hypothetical protein NQ318_012790 [Aromia moschata]|uniref:Calponin-homology (CH) domain-containing protein n=1 Tax=Aromia moschata TaxID=1265417 RepID=A0AAV8YJA4_9CUCU|nr:hypothetical protein NQ318_012790 [Aromia moschata]